MNRKSKRNKENQIRDTELTISKIINNNIYERQNTKQR